MATTLSCEASELTDNNTWLASPT